jgi:septal ring factor EnvC (AmiA/AmiB activator)
MGSELVGESVVLFISAGVIIYEYQRSKQKEMEKTAKAQAIATQERYELQQQLNAIHTRIEAIEQSIEMMVLSQQQKENTIAAKHIECESDTTITPKKSGNLLNILLPWWRK